jgi:hypothetical protein
VLKYNADYHNQWTKLLTYVLFMWKTIANKKLSQGIMVLVHENGCMTDDLAENGFNLHGFNDWANTYASDP